ncbi:MAG: hypothetical protein ACREO0_14815 [Pseudoxanthomonas sp.]
MDPKLKDLVARSNIGDLLQAPAPELDLNQPVETAQPAKIDAARSTVDPLQINFAAADIAGKLQDSRTGKGVKIFAFVFLGGPMMIFGLGLVVMAWSNPEVGIIRALFGTAFGLAIAGFWPYLIFKKRSRRS